VSSSALVRFGLIGYGLWGRHHATALAAAPGATLAAIACGSEASATAAARDFPGVPVELGYRALLARSDVDAVALASLPHAIAASVAPGAAASAVAW